MCCCYGTGQGRRAAPPKAHKDISIGVTWEHPSLLTIFSDSFLRMPLKVRLRYRPSLSFLGYNVSTGSKHL